MANDIPDTSVKLWTLESLHLGVSDIVALLIVVSSESTIQTWFIVSRTSLFQTQQLRYPPNSSLRRKGVLFYFPWSPAHSTHKASPLQGTGYFLPLKPHSQSSPWQERGLDIGILSAFVWKPFEMELKCQHDRCWVEKMVSGNELERRDRVRNPHW